jgi:SAM-dependent methyltransferase
MDARQNPSADRYLKSYAAADRRRRGLIALPATWFRNVLDHKAIAQGQRNRFGLFLPRAAELCGLTLRDPFTVLELGAGDGWALRCEHHGLRKIAVDAAPVFKDALIRDGVEFHTADISQGRLPIDNNSVDLLMMNHVIEHVATPAHLLNECRRVLRAGGGLYIRTPNIERVGHGFWNDYTHCKPYTASSLASMASAFGFHRLALLASDHTRICLDLLTDGRLRSALFLNGKEVEAGFAKLGD